MSLVRFLSRNHPQQAADDLVDDRATPWEIFSELDRRFRFTVDVAAARHNTKLPRFFDCKRNGLLQPWGGETVWCNPPYSNISPWVEKAWSEPDATVVMLLPANRTEQAWWMELVEPHRDRGGRLSVEFLRGRIRFLRPGCHRSEPNERPPFGCCLLIWRRHS